MSRPETRLERQYRLLNRQWFGNRLPPDMKVRWSRSLPHSIYGCYDEPSWGDGILINAELMRYPEVAMITLLHEMAHVATEDEKAHHGPRWFKLMRRLARLGAFDKYW